MSKKKALTVNSREVVQVAELMFPNQSLSVNRREAALITMVIMEQVQGDKAQVFTWSQFVELYNPEYKNSAQRVRRSMEQEAKSHICQLATVSSSLAGDQAFVITPIPREALSYKKRGVFIPPSAEEAVRMYRPGAEYIGVFVGTDPNGTLPVAWVEFNKSKGKGLVAANKGREQGWVDSGQITGKTLTEVKNLLQERNQKLLTKGAAK